MFPVNDESQENIISFAGRYKPVFNSYAGRLCFWNIHKEQEKLIIL